MVPQLNPLVCFPDKLKTPLVTFSRAYDEAGLRRSEQRVHLQVRRTLDGHRSISVAVDVVVVGGVHDVKRGAESMASAAASFLIFASSLSPVFNFFAEV